MKGTPPVKVIRRNSHFFDRRQLRHIDIEAQTKPDQQRNKQTYKEINKLEKSSVGADEMYGRHGQTVVATHFGRPAVDGTSSGPPSYEIRSKSAGKQKF